MRVAAVELVSMSENYAFRVDAAGGSQFVLRLHRPGYHDLGELISEQTWTEALRAAGLDVPVPLMTRAGEGYAEVRVGEEKRYAGMLEWVPGATLAATMAESDDEAFVDSRYAKIGEIMAGLHLATERWPVPPGFRRHAFDAGGLMGVGGERPFWGRFWESELVTADDRARLADMRDRIGPRLARLERTPANYGLIHADLHPHNVIVSGDRLHLIDFDDAGFGWHAYDFAVCLGRFEGLERRQAALLEGYRRVRVPDPVSVALIPLFVLIRQLVSIGWISARPDQNQPQHAAHLAAYARRHAGGVFERLDSADL